MKLLNEYQKARENLLDGFGFVDDESYAIYDFTDRQWQLKGEEVFYTDDEFDMLTEDCPYDKLLLDQHKYGFSSEHDGLVMMCSEYKELLIFSSINEVKK